MLVLICGTLGKGKTLLSTIFGKIWNVKYKMGVVSNYQLGFKYIPFNPYDFAKSKYRNKILLIDEIYTMLDSRNSMSKENQAISYILNQSRKMKIDIFSTLQIKNEVDLRYRGLVDLLIEANGKYLYYKGQLYKIRDSISNKELIPYQKYIYYKYTYYDETIYNQFLRLDVASKFYNCYNTNEIIKAKNQDELAEMFMNPNDFKKRTNEIAEQLYNAKKHQKRITHNDVITWLFDNDKSKIFNEKIIYAKVQKLKESEVND